MLAMLGTSSLTSWPSQNMICAIATPSSLWSSMRQLLTNRALPGKRLGTASYHRGAAKEILCLKSLDETLNSLEKNGHLQHWIRQCADELLPLLSGANVVKKPESPWKTTYASNETFFENIYGFKSTELLSNRKGNLSPQLHFVRRFFSHRHDPQGRSPFQKGSNTSDQNIDDEKSGKISAAFQDLVFGKRNKSRNSKLRSKSSSLPESNIIGQIGNDPANSSSNSKTSSFREKINFFSSLLIIIFFFLLVSQSINVPMLKISQAVKEISAEDVEVTFNDVRGCDEAKKELQEIVEFLRNPEKFSALGGKLPKGCLLIGPPGTGKTLLAKAVAGEAGVPFFHACGSEFDEVFVGQGAKRIRELFKSAKYKAPCLIFIDEIDVVGASRTSSPYHPYANQTVNQLLSEMDGFLSNEGVIVLGATNRAEGLDKALLRPGRFDTQVTVPKPDMKGRIDIFKLYLGQIKHDSSIDVEKLAKLTIGFSGADIENIVNTAAIRAAILGKNLVTMTDFEYSHDKHVLGTDWKSRVRDKEDLKITAYHEAGHTLVAFFTENAIPLHKVTIVAKGFSGGHTAFLPKKDEYHQTKAQILASLDVSMGGRAAEEIIFGKEKITGGASDDLKKATSLAEAMVKELGMSDKIGLRVIHDKSGYNEGLGPATSELIDAEVNIFLNDSYKRALNILKSHRRELDLLAEALLDYETLDASDIKSILEGNQKEAFQKLKKEQRRLASKVEKVIIEDGVKNKPHNPNELGDVLV